MVTNAVIAVLCIHNNTTCVLMCKKHNKYFLPGGILKPGEAPWIGLKREFHEEIELSLPVLYEEITTGGKQEVPRIDYHQHTRMYAGYVRSFGSGDPYDYEGPKSRRNKEVEETTWVDIRYVRQMDASEWKASYMKSSWHVLDTQLIQRMWPSELNIRP